MKFSICIPTHRLDSRLLHTLKSLESLDYPREDFEICLLVNGVQMGFNPADPNDSLVCDQFHYIPDTLGPSRAKNESFKLATHDWIVLLDSDDFLVPSALKRYARFIQENPIAVLGYELSALNFIGAPGRKEAMFPETTDEYRKFFNRSVSTLHETAACGRPILFKKSELIPFDPNFPFAEDRKLALDYWKVKHPVHLLGTCTYVYNWNESGVTKGRSLHEIPPEEKAYFTEFTEWIKRQPKTSNAFADEKFEIPGKEDYEAIQKFLSWENGIYPQPAANNEVTT